MVFVLYAERKDAEKNERRQILRAKVTGLPDS
jgi:hypothetical protein